MKKLLCCLVLATISIVGLSAVFDKIVKKVKLDNGDILEILETPDKRTKIYNGSRCILDGKYRIKKIDKKSGYIIYSQPRKGDGVKNSFGGDIIPAGSGCGIRLVSGPGMIYFLALDNITYSWGMFNEEGDLIIPCKYKYVENGLDRQILDKTSFRCVIFSEVSGDMYIYSLDKKAIVKKYEKASFFGGRIDDKLAPDVIRQYYQIITVDNNKFGVFDCYHCKEVIQPKYRNVSVSNYIEVSDWDSHCGAFDLNGNQLIPIRKRQFIDINYDDIEHLRVDLDDRIHIQRIPSFNEKSFLYRGSDNISSSYENYGTNYETPMYSYPNSNNTYTTTSSSTSSQQKEVHYKEKCFKCNGTGRLKIYFSVPTFGNNYEVWCEECHSTYLRSDSHRHVDCDMCNGSGYIDMVTYR